MNKAIKYRLYPTTEQCVMFAKTFGCCRKVYNLMLSDKIRSYQETGRFVSVTPAMYKEDYPYLREVDSLALANVQLNLQRAFKACFDKSRKKRNGFPKFKSAKHSRKAYTTNNQHGTVAVMERAIKLPKIGRVKAVIHRVPDTDWILKSVTVSQEPDGRYYASVLFEYEKPVIKVPVSDSVIGLDYASDGLYVDDRGNTGSRHKYYRESHAKLAKAQRRLSHMQGSQKGETKSCNYIKQLRKVNKIHRHISRGLTICISFRPRQPIGTISYVQNHSICVQWQIRALVTEKPQWITAMVCSSTCLNISLPTGESIWYV